VRVRHVENHEILESVFVEMEPALCGFVGVLVNLSREGEEFVFTETAAGTGNRLLTFSSHDCDLVYRLMWRELGARPPGGAPTARDDLP
jgi:hypothetical protein